MITIRKYDTKLLINFDFNWRIVELIKTFPNKKYHKVSKTWELPIHSLSIIKGRFEQEDLRYEIIDETTEQLAADKYIFKTQPRVHQVEGFEYGCLHTNWFLGDDQGIGKTKQALDIASYKHQTLGYKHCLIIVGVKNLRINWMREVEKHTNETACIIGSGINGRYLNYSGKLAKSGLKDRLAHLEQLPPEYFWIINGESLREAEISDLLKKYIRLNIISMVIVDEIHKLKNPVSQQGKGLLKLTETKEKILLSGTPIENSPLDGYMILKLLGVEKRTLTAFKMYYCEYGGFGGYQILGYRNMQEYKAQFKNIMLRRMKKDVLDLPPKNQIIEYLEMSWKQKLVYDQIKAGIKAEIDKIKLSSNPLAQLLRLRQVTSHPTLVSSKTEDSVKFERILDIVDEYNSSGKKVVIFSQFRTIVEMLYKLLEKYNPAICTGAVKDKQTEIDKFQEDETCGVIIGTSKAMGTGFNLTAGECMIRVERAWTMSTSNQEEDRLYRIGTKKSVNIITLVCADTIDEKIEELVAKKGAMSDYLIDGHIQGDKTELLDWILD